MFISGKYQQTDETIEFFKDGKIIINSKALSRLSINPAGDLQYVIWHYSLQIKSSNLEVRTFTIFVPGDSEITVDASGSKVIDRLFIEGLEMKRV